MTTTNQTNQIFTPRQLGRGESEKSTLNFLTSLPLNKLFLTFLIHPSSPAMLRYDRYCLRRLSAPSLTLEVRQKWDGKWRCNALISAAVYTPPSSGGMSEIRGRRGGDNCDKTPQRFNLTKWRGGRIREIWDGHPESAVSLHLGVKWGDGAETDGGRERAAWVKEIFSYCSFRVCSGLRTHTHRYTLSLIDEAPSRPLFAAFTPWLWHNKSEVQTLSSSYTLQPEICSRVEASPAALIPIFNHETTFVCQFFTVGNLLLLNDHQIPWNDRNERWIYSYIPRLT